MWKQRKNSNSNNNNNEHRLQPTAFAGRTEVARNPWPEHMRRPFMLCAALRMCIIAFDLNVSLVRRKIILIEFHAAILITSTRAVCYTKCAFLCVCVPLAALPFRSIRRELFRFPLGLISCLLSISVACNCSTAMSFFPLFNFLRHCLIYIRSHTNVHVCVFDFFLHP